MLTIETKDPNQTEQFARLLGRHLKAGDILSLDGDLGTGKTVFSRGIARALGINEPVTSPTFIIMQEYKEGRIPLYHFDVYRIEDPEELYEIGADEYFGGDGVCLIEWASLIRDILPEKQIHITISKDNHISFDHRTLAVEGLDEKTETEIEREWKEYEDSCN